MFHDVKWWRIARQNWAHREFVSGNATAQRRHQVGVEGFPRCDNSYESFIQRPESINANQNLLVDYRHWHNNASQL